MINFARRTSLTLFVLSIAWTLAPGTLGARKDKAADGGVRVERWLVTDPVPYPLPALADEKKGGYGLAQVLDETNLHDHRIRPRAGESSAWFGGATLRWAERGVGKNGRLGFEPPASGAGKAPAVAWLATYLEVDRWREMALTLGGAHPRRAWLDGEAVASGGAASADDKVEGQLKLSPGQHVLLIKTVHDPERDAPWGLTVTLGNASTAAADVVMSLDPRRDLQIRDVLDPPRITSLAVSPDGARLALSVSRVVPGTHDSESWVEIRGAAAGALQRSWRGALDARQVAFSPDGRYISYIAKSPGSGDDPAGDLMLLDLRSNEARPLLHKVARLEGYLWSPTGRAIAYWTTVKHDKDERGVKLLEGLLDRWATFRDKQYLHLVDVPDGTRRRLTAGALTTSARAFSPDGARLLFTRQVEALGHRPYTRNELWEIDLRGFAARKLRDFTWFGDAAYAPAGDALLIAASADAFGDVGVNLSRGGLPNNYDGQLFIWNPATDEVRAITREFDPAVTDAEWSRADGNIYLTAQDRDYVRLYRFDPRTSQFAVVDVGHDTFSDLTLAHGTPVAAGQGSSPWQPEALVAVDLTANAARTLAHPAGERRLQDVRVGQVRPWSFTASNGKTIDGRVYYPPAFDESRKYPAIVYYYGGTSPVGRDFGGRYPKELWAAHGYVVYVLQPSGATGFGQDFSAVHVNDWGKTTSEEIIDGTRAFLQAHPFVDPARVGCIGASYGGFMTMLLTTKTDLFSAAVAHAGISSLASYWGEGYWGFLYSAVATAESFPWNRPDIYVDHSPLFRADKSRVPLLLTHGVSDTNVPVGESDAFYIALKLLGKDVEYLQVEGQDHWIVDHAKRLVWNDSILAWFDRYLKDRPEWWNALHPAAATDSENKTEKD